jgi:RNA polymerase sigma factor (sigma-70 family)
MTDDATLLRRFAEDRSEEAFTEVVHRHLNLVYSAALRKTNGDSHLAEDVSQKVFTLLAQKAGTLARHPALIGWLYTTTHFTAAKTVRAERRRQAREQEAHAMQDPFSSRPPGADWAQLRTVLDDAMHQLRERDREAVLLRFFEGRPFAEVGARQGVSENAARMRVERALETLHALLTRRGITSTTAALTLLLAEHAVVAAPAGLAAAVCGTAVAGAATAGGGTFALWSLMTTPKLLAGLGGAAVLAVGIGVVVQQQTTADLRAEVDALQQQAQVVTRLRAENQRLTQLQVPPAELERLLNDSAEFARLRDEEAALSARLAGRTPTAASANTPKADLPAYQLYRLDEHPHPTRQIAPVYPLAMRLDEVPGEAVIDFIVDTEGNVVEATVAKSTDPAFTDAALAAVRSWKFTPGKKAGQPVNTRMRLPMTFTFESSPPAGH